MVSDLVLCKLMHWTVEDVLSLPIEYYDILIELAPDWLRGGAADSEL